MAAQEKATCEDISMFMEQMRGQRLADDRIVHELNSIFPTKEFAGKVDFTAQCKSLYEALNAGHSARIKEITNCIHVNAEKTRILKEKRDLDPENYKISKTLRRDQGNLRLFQQELNVEEIVWERAEKAFYERCRMYYRPDTS